jgi:hypothetical protein
VVEDNQSQTQEPKKRGRPSKAEAASGENKKETKKNGQKNLVEEQMETEEGSDDYDEFVFVSFK